MQWDNVDGNPVSDDVNYGDLMNLVDFNNRWTYRGSVTSPPCARFVHWNVLSNVYPISEKHLKLFKKQMCRNCTQHPPLVETGNWRTVQPIHDEHNIKLVHNHGPTEHICDGSHAKPAVF